MALACYSNWVLHNYRKSLFFKYQQRPWTDMLKNLKVCSWRISHSDQVELLMVIPHLSSWRRVERAPLLCQYFLKEPLTSITTTHNSENVTGLSKKKFESFWIVADKWGRKKEGLVQLRVKNSVRGQTQAMLILMVPTREPWSKYPARVERGLQIFNLWPFICACFMKYGPANTTVHRMAVKLV